MAGRIGNILRFVALLGLAVLLAACAPVEGPRFGSGPPVLSPKTLKTLSKPTPVTTEVGFSLDPITNAPGEMIYAYQDALKAKAATRQLKILATDDPMANYRLKIYLSAVGDYSATLMLYVVDIFDDKGVRIHRISGQITAGGSLSDPWANIKDTGVVAQAAQETIDALGNWAHS